MAFAQNEDVSELRKEIEKLQSQVSELKEKQDKAEAQLYVDAKEQASKNVGILAGIDEKGKIFLQSADGSALINFSGQIQFRYIFNNMDNNAGRSDSLSGFQMRRVKFGMGGKFGDGWGYKLVFATSRNSGPGGGNAFTEDAYITKKLGKNFTVLAGTAKLPFARQELISSSRQVGVDRGLATEFFTLNRSDQVKVSYKNGDILAQAAISDGGNADFTGFGADASNDFAVTGRVDWMAVGDDWGAMKHEFGGVKDDALFLGGAVHYEVAEGGGAPPVADAGLAWTLDMLYKTGSLGLSAAVFGNHTSNVGAGDTAQYGVYVQGDYKLDDKWDIFGRWEWIDDDNVDAGGGGSIQAITLGVNRHFNKRVKLTGDVVWIYEGDDLAADGNFLNGGELSSGLGLSSTGFNANQSHDSQVALRIQLQLLF